MKLLMLQRLALHTNDDILTITSDKPLYLAKEKIKTIERPSNFLIIIKDENTLPKNKELGI